MNNGWIIYGFAMSNVLMCVFYSYNFSLNYSAILSFVCTIASYFLIKFIWNRLD